MFCSNCGAQLDDDALFCPECGEKQIPVEAAPSGGMPAAGGPGLYGGQTPDYREMGGGAPAPVPSGNNNKLRNLLIAAIAVLAVVCIGVGILLIRSRRSNAVTGAESGTEGTGTAQGAEDADSQNGQNDQPGSGTDTVLGGESGEAAAEGTDAAQAGESEAGGTQTFSDTPRQITLADNDLARTVAELNSGTAEQMDRVDVFASAATPRRNTSLRWDNSLFYTLEDVFPDKYTDGQINSYLVTRKSFVNSSSGNRMEYEIYSKPGSGVINKIVSIEYFSNRLEITDYYYTDNGQINFIFVRSDVNYVPSYAVPSKDGERYYFNSDCLVKWRIVSSGNINNYCIGSASLEENKQGAEISYDRMDAASRSSYDAAEQRMLDAAYNTYRIVTAGESVSWISGSVYTQDEAPRTDAVVYLKNGSDYIYKCSPDGDGAYNIAVPLDENTYEIEIDAPRCETIVIYDIHITIDVVRTYVDAAYTVEQPDTQYQQVIQVRDALNYASDGVSMAPVGDAQVNFRKGFNARTTEVVASGQTDSAGNLNISLIPGAYTAEVIKTGYDVIYINIVIRIDGGTIEIHFSPSLPAGEMRIVLSWGAWPEDLDSHLFTPYDSALGDAGYHIFYSNKTDAVGDNLDVDDTTSYGPETITIPVVKNGLYKYYVVDYTNCTRGSATSYDMSNSGAVVNVYSSQGLVATFHVPTNQSGVIWEVFEIRNGQIIPNQRYYNNITGTDWWYR